MVGASAVFRKLTEKNRAAESEPVGSWSSTIRVMKAFPVALARGVMLALQLGHVPEKVTAPVCPTMFGEAEMYERYSLVQARLPDSLPSTSFAVNETDFGVSSVPVWFAIASSVGSSFTELTDIVKSTAVESSEPSDAMTDKLTGPPFLSFTGVNDIEQLGAVPVKLTPVAAMIPGMLDVTRRADEQESPGLSTSLSVTDIPVRVVSSRTEFSLFGAVMEAITGLSLTAVTEKETGKVTDLGSVAALSFQVMSMVVSPVASFTGVIVAVHWEPELPKTTPLVG